MQRGSQSSRALEHNQEPPRAQRAFGAFVFPALCAGRGSQADISATRHRASRRFARHGCAHGLAREVLLRGSRGTRRSERANRMPLHAAIPGAFLPARAAFPLSHIWLFRARTPRDVGTWDPHRGAIHELATARTSRSDATSRRASSEYQRRFSRARRQNSPPQPMVRRTPAPPAWQCGAATAAGPEAYRWVARRQDWFATAHRPLRGRSHPQRGASCPVSTTAVMGARQVPHGTASTLHTKGDAAHTPPGTASTGRAPHVGR